MFTNCESGPYGYSYRIEEVYAASQWNTMTFVLRLLIEFCQVSFAYNIFTNNNIVNIFILRRQQGL